MTGALAGRRALVTGGAKGIGAAIAQAFAAEGAATTVFDVDYHAGEAAQATGIRFIAADVTDCGQVQAQVQALVAGTGPFDILVNNAGMDQHAFFTDTSPSDWRRLIAVNLESVLAVTHAVLPGMQAAGFGRIVNIASEAARLGSRGGAVYAAAKAGVIAFTRSIARENARYGVTANVVAPGPIDTPMLRAAVGRGGGKLLDAMTDATLLRRLGTPDEVAAAVVFLAGTQAGYITGETLGVSGGMGIGAT